MKSFALENSKKKILKNLSIIYRIILSGKNDSGLMLLNTSEF